MKAKCTALVIGLILAGSLALPATAQTVMPSTPMANGTPVQQPMRQPGHDHRRQIIAGIHKIEAAYNHLAEAGDDWGGHREAAMHHLESAKHELEEALEFENQKMGH